MKKVNTILQTLGLLLLLLAAPVAQATTKTVTYTLDLYTQSAATFVRLTHSGDTPFDSNTTIEDRMFSNSNYNFSSAHFSLPDGFTFDFEWGSASSLQSSGIGYSHEVVNLKYKVTWNFFRELSGANYYVTRVQLTDINGNPMKLEGGGTATTDYTYSEQESSKTYTAAKGPANSSNTGAFKKLIITYSDVPGLSIFESAGTNAYKIKGFIDLRRLADYVNKGKNDCNGLTFIQTSAIAWNNNFTYKPIGYNNGSDKAPFSGTYDGQGRTIGNITVNTPSSSNIGIFGYVIGGTVQGIVLDNCTFTGLEAVGGIVGENRYGTVRDCWVKSSVAIHAGAGNARFHGGIVGYNDYEYPKYPQILGCVSAATVSNDGHSGCISYGGIVGTNKYGTIRDCLYIGSPTETTITGTNYVGSIAGSDSGGQGTYFYNNYYIDSGIGAVDGSDRNGARLGYTVSLNDDGISPTGNQTLYNASGLTAYGTGNSALRHGPILYSGEGQSITFTYSGTIPEGCNYAFSTTGTTAGILANATLTMTAANAEVFGIFTWTGSGSSANDPYLISHPCQMNQLAIDVNSGVEHQGKFFALNNDLTYDYTSAWDATDSEENNYTPIGGYYGGNSKNFRGTFDGRGKTISGIRVCKTGTGNEGSNAGLFGNVSGTVKNLTLTDARISAHGNCGGIAGNNGGTIENCHVTATVCLHARADHGRFFGGIAGQNSLSIQGCTSAATLTVAEGITDCNDFGGIAGYQGQGSVANSLAIGVKLPGDMTHVGVICGRSYTNNRFYRNLFRDCTLGGEVTTVGFTYSETPYSTVARAEPGHFVSTGAGLTADPNSGSSYKSYDYNGLSVRNTGSGDNERYSITYKGITYYGTGFAINLLGASNVLVTKTSDNTDVTAEVLSGTTLTMPAFDVTVVINTGNIRAFLKDGHYWATYYNGASRKILPAGATAYTMDGSKHLYRLGTDGSVIPAGVAVVILADSASIELTDSDETSPVEDHAPDGNILLGSDVPIALDANLKVPVPGSDPAATGMPCVLSIRNNILDFRQFSGTAIPANRAYYIVP